MIVCFDLDGTLCTQRPAGDYENAEPLEDRIVELRSRYYRGSIVKIWTARGAATGIDWSDVTRKQLAKWNVPYHELSFGKPYADIYVDDRAVKAEEWFSGGCY